MPRRGRTLSIGIARRSSAVQDRYDRSSGRSIWVETDGNGGVRPIDIWRRSIEYESRSMVKDRDWMDDQSGIGGTTNTLVRFCKRKTHAPAVPLSRTKKELKKDGDSKDVVLRS